MGQEGTDDPNCGQDADAAPPLRIGCALLPKKASRYLTAAVIDLAQKSGIELCSIDPSQPLSQQGPLDAIIHKLHNNTEWERNLLGYMEENPKVKVVDRLESIRLLRNRSTMLAAFQDSGFLLQPENGGASAHIRAPLQVTLQQGVGVGDAEGQLAHAGLVPPMIVKPMWSDGREGSHGLAVLHDLQGLQDLFAGKVASQLMPPLVVQQFVEHGGVLFKVYVLGSQTFVSTRPSLSGLHWRDPDGQGVQRIGRVSAASARAAAAKAGYPQLSPPEQPPSWVTDTLARTLREHLGMHLFNFDMICPESQDNGSQKLYYVVDINYFPGVDKIPGFEQHFVEFLSEACTKE